MALIKCTECGKEFSDKAVACPNCGCPKDEIIKELNKAKKETENIGLENKTENDNFEKNSKIKFILIGLIIVISLGVGYFVLTGNSRNYSKAQEMMQQEDFEGAKIIFEELGEYENSKELVRKCEYELSEDRMFIRELSKALAERWDYNDETKDEEETALLYDKYCQIELDRLETFYNKNFDDSTLGEVAKAYINCLKSGKEAAKQYTANFQAFNENWGKVYGDRTILIVKMVKEYGLKVDEAHQKTLEELVTDGDAEEENRKAKQSILDMCEDFKIKEYVDEYGYKTYKVEMKNATNLTFDYFYITVNYLDKNGNIKNQGGFFTSRELEARYKSYRELLA